MLCNLLQLFDQGVNILERSIDAWTAPDSVISTNAAVTNSRVGLIDTVLSIFIFCK
ncbi:MAG: hypothetical protein ACOCV0_04440 [Alkalispirochaeta sp.]